MRRLLPLLATLLALGACGGSEEPDAAPSGSSATAGATPSPTPTGLRYVALGDSYTAAPLVPPTDVSSICLRSGVNYPALVATALPGTELTDVSCSGATTANVTQAQVGRLARPERVPPQIDAVSRRTDLVTIGLGGNDEQLFGGLIGRCTQAASSDPQGAPCTATYPPGELDQTFAHIADNIAGVVRTVRDKAPDARVLVVGYPQIVPARGTCDLLPIAAGDYPFAREVNQRLTDAVRAGAEQADAEYVDMWRASAGHDICAAEPWINGPVSSGQTALAYHPFAVEQQAVADLVLAALR